MGYIEEDYLMRYFNQLSVVLAKILKLKTAGNFEEAHEVIDNCLVDFGLKTSEHYMSIDDSLLITELLESQKMDNDQIKVLAELFFEKAEINSVQGDHKVSRRFYSKALMLLHYLTQVEKVYSFEREEKIKKIKSILKL